MQYKPQVELLEDRSAPSVVGGVAYELWTFNDDGSTTVTDWGQAWEDFQQAPYQVLSDVTTAPTHWTDPSAGPLDTQETETLTVVQNGVTFTVQMDCVDTHMPDDPYLTAGITHNRLVNDPVDPPSAPPTGPTAKPLVIFHGPRVRTLAGGAVAGAPGLGLRTPPGQTGGVQGGV